MRLLLKQIRILCNRIYLTSRGGWPTQVGCPVRAWAKSKAWAGVFAVTSTVRLYERKSPLKAKKGLEWNTRLKATKSPCPPCLRGEPRRTDTGIKSLWLIARTPFWFVRQRLSAAKVL